MKRLDKIVAAIDAAKVAVTGAGLPVTPANLAHKADVSEGTMHRWLNAIPDGREGIKGRKDADTRKDELLVAAVAVAAETGFSSLSRKAIALKAGVSEPLVNQYLGTIPQLKRKVMRAAVAQGVLSVIAEGLVLKDEHALKASSELKQQALNSI